MVLIAPSLLAADFSRLREEVFAVQTAGADMLHLDVMDGHFVPNLSFGVPIVSALRRCVALPFDVHLMLARPQQYLAAFAAAGANSITIHTEADCCIPETLAEIRRLGIAPCLSLKPGTPADTVFPYLDSLAMVLLMSVEPGFGGQQYLPQVTEKIAALRSEIDRRALSVKIQVDGGITAQTIAAPARAGAQVFVAGSAVFGSADYAEAIASLRAAAS